MYLSTGCTALTDLFEFMNFFQYSASGCARNIQGKLFKQYKEPLQPVILYITIATSIYQILGIHTFFSCSIIVSILKHTFFIIIFYLLLVKVWSPLIFTVPNMYKKLLKFSLIIKTFNASISGKIPGF